MKYLSAWLIVLGCVTILEAQTPQPGGYVPGSDRAITEARAGAPPQAPQSAPNLLAPLAGAFVLIAAIGIGLLFILAILTPYFIYRIHGSSHDILIELRAIRAMQPKG